MRSPHFISICAKNYLAFARTLFDSLKEFRPDAEFTLFLADRIDGSLDPKAEKFEVIEAKDVGIEDFDAMALRYDITEFNTAVKPSCIKYLFERDPGRPVVYLDPDILVTGALPDLDRLFTEGWDAILTPHACAGIEDGKLPDDLTFLRVGVYNLGFLGLADTPETRAFLGWWERRLRYDCRVDLEEGLHVDQKWVDLLPTFIDKVKIFRDPGYNAAYWNLMHRRIEERDGHWTANGRPLQFFHFSGAEGNSPDLFSKHQNRFTLRSAGDAGRLLTYYREKVVANGRAELSKLPYAYGFDEQGRAIHTMIRRLCRKQMKPQAISGASAGKGPGEAIFAFCMAPAPEVPQSPVPVTRLMHHIWTLRPDLQAAFNLATADGRQGFYGWYLHAGLDELKLDPAYVLPLATGSATASPAHALVPAGEAVRCAAAESGPTPALAGGIAGGLAVAEMPPRPLSSSAAAWALGSIGYLRPLYRHLPPGVRSALRTRLLRQAYAPATAAAPVIAAQTASPEVVRQETPLKPGINLVGYVRGEFGVAQALRCMAKGLDATGVPFACRELRVPTALNQDESLADRIDPSMPFDVNLYHVNADQTPHLLSELEQDKLYGRYRIACWFWELEKFPDCHEAAFDLVDEIWAPSSFIQRSVALKSPKPVVYMPIAVDLSPVPANRARFGIPADSFAFLVSFDLKSFIGRKNPQAAVEAFRDAFAPERRDITLVIKVHGGDVVSEGLEELRALAASDPRVVLVEGTLSAADMVTLQCSTDAYISLHRSEGFGLHLAESMTLGKPVVATAYSGNMDFMTVDSACLVDYRLIPVPENGYPHWEGQVWADPDVEAAARYIRRLADDAAFARHIGEQGRLRVRSCLAPEVTGRLVGERLAYLRRAR